MNFKIIIIALLTSAVLCAAIFLSTHGEPFGSPPQAVGGLLNLEDLDFESSGVVPLNGEWQFYDEQFLSFDQEIPVEGNTISVPGLWNKARKSGAFGYGTYRLLVRIQDTDTTYGLKVPDFATSYRLYIDGKLICENGIPGKSLQETEPQWLPLITPFSTEAQDVEIVVHVANFAHVKGGMWKSILLGTQEQIYHQRDMAVALELFLFGSLFIICIYHLSVYILRTKERSLLFLGLFCLIMALRVLLTGEVFITSLFPGINFEMLSKLEYLTVPLGVLCFTMFVHHLYPDGFPPFSLKFIQGINLAYSVIIICFPLRVFAKFLITYQVFCIFVFFLLLFVLFKAVQTKEEGSHIIFAGTLILLITAFIDTTYANHFHNINLLSDTFPAGLVVFVFLQAFTLSLKFSNALDISESLKTDLERQVKARTWELEEANRNLYMAVIKDPLTLLYNRQEFENVVYAENIKYGERLQSHVKYSIICLDLDNFKYFNDNFGHSAGDIVLIEFAAILKKIIRSTDLAFRYGGDEFVILMPNTNVKKAISLAKRIVQETQTANKIFASKIEKSMGIKVTLNDSNSITCSIGIAYHIPDTFFNLKNLFWKADKALLQAKKTGKNRIFVNTEQGLVEP